MLPAFARPKAAWPSGVLAQDAAAISSRAAAYPWRRPAAYPARSARWLTQVVITANEANEAVTPIANHRHRVALAARPAIS